MTDHFLLWLKNYILQQWYFEGKFTFFRFFSETNQNFKNIFATQDLSTNARMFDAMLDALAQILFFMYLPSVSDINGI